MLSVNREIGSDLSGSAMILVSSRSHFEHSNKRFSEPSASGCIRASLIRTWHLEHRGRSIGIRGGSDLSNIPRFRPGGAYERGSAQLDGIAFSLFGAPENAVRHVGLSDHGLALVGQKRPGVVQRLAQNCQRFGIIRA